MLPTPFANVTTGAPRFRVWVPVAFAIVIVAVWVAFVEATTEFGVRFELIGQFCGGAVSVACGGTMQVFGLGGVIVSEFGAEAVHPVVAFLKETSTINGPNCVPVKPLMSEQATVGKGTAGVGIGMTKSCAPEPELICCGAGVVVAPPIVKPTIALPSGPTPGS